MHLPDIYDEKVPCPCGSWCRSVVVADTGTRKIHLTGVVSRREAEHRALIVRELVWRKVSAAWLAGRLVTGGEA
jgi:hypothetical protein